MNEFIAITCPHCGEEFQLALDPGEGATQLIVDCEICCRPMTVKLNVRDGAVEGVDVSAA